MGGREGGKEDEGGGGRERGKDRKREGRREGRVKGGKEGGRGGRGWKRGKGKRCPGDKISFPNLRNLSSNSMDSPVNSMSIKILIRASMRWLQAKWLDSNKAL